MCSSLFVSINSECHRRPPRIVLTDHFNLTSQVDRGGLSSMCVAIH